MVYCLYKGHMHWKCIEGECRFLHMHANNLLVSFVKLSNLIGFVFLKSILFQLLLTILSCPYFPIRLLILLICRTSSYIKGIKLLSVIYVANTSLSLLLFLCNFFFHRKLLFFVGVFNLFYHSIWVCIILLKMPFPLQECKSSSCTFVVLFYTF